MRLGRDVGVDAGVDHHLWHPLGVLADLGHAHITVDDLEASALQPGLQSAQLAQVLVHRHEGGVALVAEDRHGHNLNAGRLAGPHGGNYSVAVEKRGRLAEQVEHPTADGEADRFAKAARLGLKA